MQKKASVDRPSMVDLELMAVLSEVLPAKSFAEAARRSRQKDEIIRRYSRQGIIEAIERVSEFCRDEIVTQDGLKQYILSRTGEQLRDYALVILGAHTAIRVWPPVYHIVIGASQRTAASYLPAFLKQFLQITQVGDDSLPFQITIRESDTREEFFQSLRHGEADWGLRGLPIEEEYQGTPVHKDLTATPIGPKFRLIAVSKQSLVRDVSNRVAVVDLLRKGRVGILKMNVESVVALLSNAGERVFFPQKNVLSCESYTTMMSFINNSLCTGLIYVPLDVASVPGFHSAELSDLSSFTQCFTFCKKTLATRLDNISFPSDRKSWQREHYLATLRNIFRDAKVQKEAFTPSSEPFPFM